MEEIIEPYGNMTAHAEMQTGILILGFGVAFFVLLAIFLQCFDLDIASTLSLDKFFLTPYLKFAYVSFLKPHTGRADGGQQSALESFYSAQVGSG